MTDKITTLKLVPNERSPASDFITSLNRGKDDVESIVTIVRMKDGSSWAAWSDQSTGDVCFKEMILQRSILIELDRSTKPDDQVS